MIASREDIKTAKDIKEWFTELIHILKVSLHPDNRFEEYVNHSGFRSFDDETASELDSMMDKCFEIAYNQQVDIYGIAIEVLED